MPLPDAVRARAEHALGAPLREASAGGRLRIEGPRGAAFVKRATPDAVASEVDGLEALAGAGSGLIVPEVVAAEGDVLLTRWLRGGAFDDVAWRALGAGLARLHRSGPRDARFGWHRDNWIGAAPQRNTPTADWPTFYRRHRLEPQVAAVQRAGRWREAWDAPLRELLDTLPQRLRPAPSPALVHGDLWSGNVMATPDGPALIDPAVYRGDREVDLAMSELFGGFGRGFYEAYEDAYPLAAGYAGRRPLYDLYHLLNHLRLFGEGYAGRVDAVWRAI